MKKIVFTISVVFISNFLFAQNTDNEVNLKKQSVDTIMGWKSGGTIIANVSQTSLTNWAAGGQNSFSINGLVSLFSTYKKGKGLWENYLNIAYGSLNQGRDQNWIKTDDKIEATSKYGRKAFSKWYYAGLINFKTQFDQGYKLPDDSTKISDLMAPGYLSGAIGLDYKMNDNFTMFLSPFTSKITFVMDQELADAGAFGVIPGENIRLEYGGYIRLYYNRELMKNIALQTKLDIFSNYATNPHYMDINWGVLISMKVNEYISASITTDLIYDHDVQIAIDDNNDGIIDRTGPRTQFKETIGVGFSYNLKSKKEKKETPPVEK